MPYHFYVESKRKKEDTRNLFPKWKQTDTENKLTVTKGERRSEGSDKLGDWD